MNKKRSQMRHLKRRWLQRTGDTIDSKLHAKIVRMIREGKTRIYYKQSNRISIHYVDIDGTEKRVVYDKQRKQCVTILPKEIACSKALEGS